jgi:hypothetical protein
MAGAAVGLRHFGLAGSSDPPGMVPTRHSTSSSYSSDAYVPLPSGLWLLNLHGNCSRCHHYHDSARFKVNIPRSPNITTHVRCQGCREKWLAIGGRNASQLSLLSVNTIQPNPAAAEVRYSLVNMVRATTALATLSPVLAGIAEQSSPGPSRRQSLHAQPVTNNNVGDSSTLTSKELETRPEVEDPPNLEPQRPLRLLVPPTVRPTTTQKYGFMTGRRMSRLKQSVGERIPALHRANLRSRLGSLTKRRLSAKQQGKQPIDDPLRMADVMDNIQEPNTPEPTERNFMVVLEDPTRPSANTDRSPVTPSATAAAFLATMKNDSTDLSTMTVKQRADWVRAKYTEFINSSVASTYADANVSAESAATAEPPSEVSGDERSSAPIDLAGVGGRQSPSARSYSYRASILTVSDRISEAETVIGDDATTVASGPRSSFEQFRSARPNSTQSLNAYTLQLSRLRRAEWRRSGDSGVPVEAIPSMPRPVSRASDRSSHGSTIRRPTPDEAGSMRSPFPQDDLR